MYYENPSSLAWCIYSLEEGGFGPYKPIGVYLGLGLKSCFLSNRVIVLKIFLQPKFLSHATIVIVIIKPLKSYQKILAKKEKKLLKNMYLAIT